MELGSLVFAISGSLMAFVVVLAFWAKKTFND